MYLRGRVIYNNVHSHKSWLVQLFIKTKVSLNLSPSHSVININFHMNSYWNHCNFCNDCLKFVFILVLVGGCWFTIKLFVVLYYIVTSVLMYFIFKTKGTWSYGSWIYNYLCNHCQSPLMLWVRISSRARCTTLCDKVCQWLATGQWFSLVPPVSPTNKTDHHDITEILLKVALNTIKQTNTHFISLKGEISTSPIKLV